MVGRGTGRAVKARQTTHQPTHEGGELSRGVDDLRRQAKSFGPFGEGVKLAGLSLTTTEQEFRHGLGRVPKGWIITDRTGAQATVRRASWTKQTISLLSSASVTADVWVF